MDCFACILSKRIFKLDMGPFLMIFLQLILAVPTIMLIFLPIMGYQFVLMKLLMLFVLCLLTTNSYGIKNLFSQYFFMALIMFSVYGFGAFFVALVNATIKQYFPSNLIILSDYLIIFAIICYFFAIFALFDFLSKKKTLNSFLANVSLNLFGKHIEVTGLLDSGNSLYDTENGKAVIIVSAQVLKKVLDRDDYSKVLKGDLSTINVIKHIQTVTIGEENFNLPVIGECQIEVEQSGRTKSFDCEVGLICHDLDSDGSFECLLHKDFS